VSSIASSARISWEVGSVEVRWGTTARRSAAASLGEMQVTPNPSPDLRARVAYQVKRLDGPGADDAWHSLVEESAAVVPLIVEAYAMVEQTTVKAALVDVVAHFRSTDTVGFLADALRDRDGEIWKRALDGLVSLGPEHALTPLREMCAEAKDEEKRAWIQEAIDSLSETDPGPFRCPCCGSLTLDEQGGYDICPVCFWEDDGQGDHDADVVKGGPNGTLSLAKARANYRAFGACEERFIDKVRRPRPEKLPEES
jgi:hypothetical protein